MLGAIIGDIVGSRFEWNNYRDKDFEFLTYKCFPTDDTIMTLALAQAILVSKQDYSDLSKNAVECMQRVGRNYPDCGYGGGFYDKFLAKYPEKFTVLPIAEELCVEKLPREDFDIKVEKVLII